jgi:hypothetical protein
VNLIEQRRLINQDLYNELRYLLIAATIWQACHDIGNDDPKKAESHPHHLVVLAMDSAIMHARALYEFFFDHGDFESAGAQRDFGVTIDRTKLYDEYKHTINKRLFHIDTRRPRPEKRGGGRRVKRDINRKVKLIADDVLGLWDQFSDELPGFKRQLSGARRKAIAEATKAAKSIDGRIVFS